MGFNSILIWLEKNYKKEVRKDGTNLFKNEEGDLVAVIKNNVIRMKFFDSYNFKLLKSKELYQRSHYREYGDDDTIGRRKSFEVTIVKDFKIYDEEKILTIDALFVSKEPCRRISELGVVFDGKQQNELMVKPIGNWDGSCFKTYNTSNQQMIIKLELTTFDSCDRVNIQVYVCGEKSSVDREEKAYDTELYNYYRDKNKFLYGHPAPWAQEEVNKIENLKVCSYTNLHDVSIVVKDEMSSPLNVCEILKLCGFTSRAEYFSGRGTRYDDMNGIEIIAIYWSIYDRISKVAAKEYRKMIISLIQRQDLSATSVINALKELERTGFQFQESSLNNICGCRQYDFFSCMQYIASGIPGSESYEERNTKELSRINSELEKLNFFEYLRSC